MFIRVTSRETLLPLHHALLGAVAGSRFTADIHVEDEKTLTVKRVRLRERKPYCGQHPGPCPVNSFVEKRHLKASLLEGADWVGWNDLLNDVCDRLGVAADIWSNPLEVHGKLRVRLGRRRRVRYDSVQLSTGLIDFQRWDGMGGAEDFEDHVGKAAPPSRYPEGTPGLAGWRVAVGEGHGQT